MAIKMDHLPEDDVSSKLNELIGEYSLEQVVKAIHEMQIVPESKPARQTKLLRRSTKTVLQEFKHQLRGGSLADTTKKTYLGMANRLQAFFTERKLTTMREFVDPLTLPVWIKWANGNGNRNSTKNKYLAFTRKFLKTIFHTDVPAYLLEVLDFVKVGDDTPKAFKTSHVSEMMRVARTEFNKNKRLRNYAMIVLFIGSGIRLSELQMLQIRDIDWLHEVIWVWPKRDKKNQHRRFVSSEALQVLRTYVESIYGNPCFWEKPSVQDCFVFPAPSGEGKRPLTARAIQRTIAKIMKECTTISEQEYEILSVHSFRHYFALSQLEQGVDIYTIAKLLGHKSVKTTEIYLKLFDEQLRDAVNALSITRISGGNLMLVEGGHDAQ